MASTPIFLEFTTDKNLPNNKFIIDGDGIKSTTPLIVKESFWDGNTFKLNVTEGNIIGDIYSIGEGSIDILNNTTIDKNATISIGNVVKCAFTNIPVPKEMQYTSMLDGPKMFSLKWCDSNKKNPVIAGIKIVGNIETSVYLPLADNFKVVIMKVFIDAGRIDIHSENPKTDAIIYIYTGGVVYVHNNTLQNLFVKIHGKASVNNFHVINSIDGYIKGIGSVELTHESTCNAHIDTVKGKVNLTQI